MKKVLFILLFILHSSFAYGASSDDIYLRRDVFEVEMRNINLRFDQVLNELQSQRKEIEKTLEELKEQRREINEATKAISVLSVQITDSDKRIDSTNNFFYLVNVLLGVLIAMPFIQKWLDSREIKKEKAAPSFTLDDVKKLINEAIRANNLTIQGK